MVSPSLIRQTTEDIRRTRFVPQTRAERVALVADSIARLVPFRNTAWLFLDADGGLKDCITYPLVFPDLIKVYATDLHDNPDRTGFLPWSVLKFLPSVFDLGELTLGMCYRSEFHQRCMVPAGLHASLCIRLGVEGGSLAGLLALGRPPGEKFRRAERQAMATLQPEIARACRDNLVDRIEHPKPAIEEQGLLLIDRSGNLLHRDAAGQRLLYLAAHPYLDSAQVLLQRESAILHQLASAARDIPTAPGGGTQQPSLRVCHDRGQYDFRIHVLDAEGGLYGVVVSRGTPPLTRVARRLLNLRAGPRQKEIAILLAHGLSYPEIALELGVASSSVVTQVRQLFTKYGVYSREELIAALQGGAND